jgi:hypothetical protein
MTVKDTAWLFGEDRYVYVYGSSGGLKEINFGSMRPTFVEAWSHISAPRGMKVVMAADAATYERVRAYYWLGTQVYMGAHGNSRAIVPNTDGLFFVDEDDIEQTSPAAEAAGVQRSAADHSRSHDSELAGEGVVPDNSPGEPLDEKTRELMEARLGHEFSDVRTHTDGAAAASAHALNATAYTTGSDVYFAAGQYAPGTEIGQRLLAHELTHVVQQAAGLARASAASQDGAPPATGTIGDAAMSLGSGKRTGGLVVGHPDDPLEHEAERMAEAVTQQGPTPARAEMTAGSVTPLSGPAIQRQPKKGGSDPVDTMPSAQQGTSVPASSVPSTATWLASMGLAATDTREDTAEIASIDAQLTSLVISDEYRAQLEQRRAEKELVAGLRKEAAAALDLIALEKEAREREEAGAQGVSPATVGPTSVTVPLRTLFTVPEPFDEHALHAQLVADPSREDATDLASRYIVDQYLTGKLDWPVTIDLVEPEGQGVWFMFTVKGEALLASKKPKLPLTALDSVSPEQLSKVSDRAALIVEAAAFEGAHEEVVKTISEKAEAMIADPRDYARNEAMGLVQLIHSYDRHLVALENRFGSGQDWLRARISARRLAMLPVIERVKEMDTITNTYHEENMPPTYAGETYDRSVEESSNVVEEYGWRFLRGLGDLFTLGGQSTQAENARMYRRGEISRADYVKNWVLNIVKVGATAVVTALTAGRATGPAMRFLGLRSGTAAAAVTAGGAEGVVGGLTQALTSDAFAKAVTIVSDSPGVVAFHEQTIGGLDAWLASAGWGGAFGMAFGAGGHFWGKYRTPTPPKPGPRLAAADQPEVIGLKIKEDLNGDFTLFVEDPVSGKRLVVQGNRQTGNATVVDPLTGELVGSMRAGVIDTPAAFLTSGADPVIVPTAPVHGPSATTIPTQGPGRLGPHPRQLLGPGEAPVNRALEIEALISEGDLFDPIAAADPLDPNQFSVPSERRPAASSLAEVDISDMPLELEAEYVARFPGYIEDTLARGNLPRMGNVRDYIRFRYGVESGQLARGYKAKLRSKNPHGMSIESRLATDAGRSAEKVQGLLRTSNKNNQMYSLSFYDPVRQKWVQKNVIPDFMPTAQKDASGNFANARTAGDAVVIADSKYTWDRANQVELTDQVAAMMVLARNNNKPFVFLLGEGRDVSASVRAFAQAEGVEIHVVPDVSGQIR